MYSSVLFVACRLDRRVALQRLDQLAPAAALALQLGHAAERAGVARIDAQRLLHRVDRVLEVAAGARAYQRPIFTHRSAAEPRSSRSSSLTRLRVLVEQLLPAVGRRGEALELARGLGRASSRA